MNMINSAGCSLSGWPPTGGSHGTSCSNPGHGALVKGGLCIYVCVLWETPVPAVHLGLPQSTLHCNPIIVDRTIILIKYI